MPETLLKPVDLISLAERGQSIDEVLSLTELPRLVEALGARAESSGGLTVRLAAERDPGDRVRVTGQVEATLILTCQRCLGPVDYRLDEPVDWLFRRESDSTFVLSDDPVRLADLIEDEVLLALPQYPVHERLELCDEHVARYLASEGEPGEPQPMRTPFANLKTLMRGED